jgi:hypothetical protein
MIQEDHLTCDGFRFPGRDDAFGGNSSNRTGGCILRRLVLQRFETYVRLFLLKLEFSLSAQIYTLYYLVTIYNRSPRYGNSVEELS